MFYDLSNILSRLDRIESKLDSIIRQSRTPSSTTVSPASSRTETPIPVFTKEVSLQPVKGLMG